MHRQIARSVFILLCGAVATGLGVAGALLFTVPGRNLLARLLSGQSPRLLRGSVYIGAIRGGWVTGFALDSVVIRDTAGVPLLSASHVEVRYRLANFLAGRVVLSGVRVTRPELQLIKHRSGRLNFEEIFRLGEGKGGASPLIELHDLSVNDGRVTIRLPWNPDGRLRSARQIDSALAAERRKPGRRIDSGPEGLELIRRIDGLNAQFPLFRVSTPDRQPLTVEIAQLAARVSDPALDIRELRGTVRTKGDSLLFELEHAALPGTSGQGSGRLDWPRDTILYRFNFRLPQLALADLRFISPLFPAFTGSARVQATSLSGTRTEFDIRGLSVGDSVSKVNGNLVAISDVYRGLGFRRLDVALSNLDLEVVRPYLDTLPFYGRLTGPLRADGFFDALTVSLDWLFQDAKADAAENHVALEGRLRLGGAEGIYFDGARTSRADLDLRSVRLLAPAVILQGRLGLAGSLNGPLKNVVFAGSAEHRDSTRPASRLNGTVRLDTRGAILGLEADVVLDSLVFEGIRPSFPGLKTRGALGGNLKLAGFLDRLAVNAVLGGALGQVDAIGRVTLQPPRWGADSMRFRFQRLDLAALTGGGVGTALQGTLEASGTVDSAVAPEVRLALRLGPSRIREISLDSVTALLGAQDSVLTIDTLRAFWRGGRLQGGGTLGWTVPKNGRLVLQLEAPELAGFDSLALRLSGLARDTAAGDLPLRGSARAELTLEGALGALRVRGAATLDSLGWLAYRAKSVTGRVSWTQRAPALEAEIAADSLWRRQLVFTQVQGQLRGRPDSLGWAVSGSSRDVASLGAGGSLQEIPTGKLFHADSVNLKLLGRRWGLEGALNARLTPAALALDTVRFVTQDGSGSIQLAGDLPRQGPGQISLTALGVQLRDIYGLAQRDTAGIAGVVAVDARLSGTAPLPELRGTASITGPVFGDFHAPLIRAAFDYRGQTLRGNLTFWRTGKPVVEADLTVPYDLALQKVARRQLPGPLNIVVRGDSIDLALAEAFTPNLRQVSGLLNIDAQIEGSWETPRLAGQARIIDGAAVVPGLGIGYHGINGVLRLAQDSILTTGLHIGSRTGVLDVGGGIRLERLTSPALNLSLTAHDFELINVSNYMTLRSSGTVQLAGTLQHPVLSGSGRVTNSVIYFADLIEKDVVNLESSDPLFADLVDTLALRKYSLGAPLQSRFLDSLNVRDLQLEIGDAVWLRSNEANFQLEGRILVNKIRQVYRLDGTLDVPRGTYTLKAGFINRTFTVERGTVRYFGDLNAELDVEARHVVRTPQQEGEDIPVIAHITGTLLIPKLSLSSAPDRPPMSEPELMSLLVLGTSENTLTGLQSSQFQLSYFKAAPFIALSSELQRTIVSDLGIHAIDILEIRPGIASSGLIGGAGPTELAIGKALTRKLFVTANAGFCVGSSQPTFSPQNLGATLEYRIRRDLRAQLAAEPVQTCLLRGVDIFGITKRYQFGAELRWDRDY
ncbi:MAG TPA: translocation/assembly module TamB domain-containing protein [Gemmatimonadales bacterium]|nr:translocation/assembly module TamB domain-containing protein [Gemmatimonadales bacterium]